MAQETNYVGIKKCGCVTSALRDEGDGFFSKREIDDWVSELEADGQVVEVWDQAQVKAKFGYCDAHKPLVQQELF